MKHACEEISSLVSEGLDRRLSLRERIWMRFHFLMCGACKQYNNNMMKLHLVFKMRGEFKQKDIELPQDKRKKIKTILNEINPDS